MIFVPTLLILFVVFCLAMVYSVETIIDVFTKGAWGAFIVHFWTAVVLWNVVVAVAKAEEPRSCPSCHAPCKIFDK